MASRSTRSRRLHPVQHPESHSRAKWTPPVTKTLVDLLVDEVCKGSKRNKSFNKKTWERICEDFRDNTGLTWDDEQVKSKYATLRKQYVAVKSLLDQGDFEWVEATGAIVAASDEAWDRYTKEHRDYETLRSSGCPMYKELCTIFTLPAARGNYNQSNGSNPCTQREQEESSSSGWEQVTDTADDHENNQCNAPSRVVVGQKRGRKGVDGAIARAILEMAAASKLRAAAIQKLNGRYSVTDCVRALDELEGVSEDIYFAALDLFNNRSARETFLCLKNDKRLTWLSLKCLGTAKADGR